MIFKSTEFDHPPMDFVSKGWGWERWITNSEKYCGKLLFVAKKRKMSFHYHKLKDETFYLHSGKVVVRFTDDHDIAKKIQSSYRFSPGRTWRDFVYESVLKPGDNLYIPPGRIHQIEALRDSELFEFSTQHFDEDSYRVERGD